MDYATVKALHQGAVVLSIAGFALRGGAALAGAAWVRSRPARTLPHVVDTVLLGSALVLLAMLHADPLRMPWLLAKIGGLVAYIGLGMLALRPGLPRGRRAAAFVAALGVAGWIVSVALSKQPVGWFSG